MSQAIESEIEIRLRRKLESEQESWREKEKAKLEKKVKDELQEKRGAEFDELQEALTAKDKLLKEARKSELEVRRKARELEERAEAFEIEKAQILDAERKKIQASAEEKAEEKLKLKLQEKDIQLKSLAGKIDELQKKSEKGSQELQGSAQEVELMEILQKAFPEDGFERVAKGRRGGDLIQTINQGGKQSGKIVYESKRTTNWSNSWIEKLRTDRNLEKADVAVLVSDVLPDFVKHAGCMEGIWVCDFRTAVVLVSALRNGLVELARVRSVLANQADMKDVVFRYLTGNEFKQRIERICRTFIAMKSQIEKERTQSVKWLAERDQQLNLIAEDVHGFRGEIDAMLQAALPPGEHLALAAG